MIAEVFNSTLARNHQKLVQVLISLGAEQIHSHGDLWLELSASRLLGHCNRSDLY